MQLRAVVLFPVVLIITVLATTTEGSAQSACWIDRERDVTASQLPVTSPRVAGMREAAHEINRALGANATLTSLPEVRVRSTWQIIGHPDDTGDPYGVHLVLWAHGRDVWDDGPCDLIPQADRVDPMAAIVVVTNSINSTLAQVSTGVSDEQLRAFAEPEVVGRIGGYPVYRGQWIVLTFDGRIPWIPVTMSEYLDFEERRLVALEAESASNIAEVQANTSVFDEDAVRETFEAMRAVDPAQAEEFRTMMEEVRKQTAAAAAEAPTITNAYTPQLADLRAFRASLTPSQLEEQAREGRTSATPLAPVDKLVKLVKMDPSFPWDREDANRIRLMEIHYSGRQGTPYEALMDQVANSLDWAAFEALMR